MLNVRQIWTGCILLSTALSSSAVTLGRHSGGAILGQPLDVRVQVLLAPGEDIANQCLNADVQYGDVQLPRSAVRITPQRTAPDAEASVRIQSSQAINEPFVTLFVRAGCDTAFTRRFVVLADPLSEPLPAPSARASSPSVFAPVPVVPRMEAAPSSSSSSSGAPPSLDGSRPAASGNTAAGAARQTTRPAPRDRQAAAPSGAPRSVVRRPAAAAPVAPAPRLQLDPIDLSLSIERDPVLKLSPALLSEPGTSEEARAAAGLLWKAINASPEEVLQEARKLSALEAETTRLRETQAQTQARLNELNAQLAQAEDQRYRNWLVYLLGGLLLLALLALLIVSRRRSVVVDGSSASRAWWSPDAAEKAQKADKAEKAGKAAAVRGGPVLGLRKTKEPALDKNASDRLNAEHRFDLDQDSSLDSIPGMDGNEGTPETVPLGVGLPLPAARDRRDFAPSALGGSRSVAAEELFDVQQQADFFVSLGEEERAIQVLRNHLAESHEPSPLAYLDLFRLYHSLGRREDYDELRSEFNHVFNAGAPPFNQYSSEGRGLEAYPSAFRRIQSLWPEPRVLDLLENSIFRDANDDQVEVFDLEAYRELLLLHAIAKDLIQRDGSAAIEQGDFRRTNIRPLKPDAGAHEDARQAASVGRNTQPMLVDRMQPNSSRLGLDINLDDLGAFSGTLDASEPSEISAFEALLPDVEAPVEPAARAERNDAPSADGYLMDFEIVDFMAPDEEPPENPDDRRKPNKGRQ